jgi:hypothetical protein
MINPSQLRYSIVMPTLVAMDMWSPAAENLLMGTAMQESRCGEYLVQIEGPALGIFQVEPATADDIIFRYLQERPQLLRRFETAWRTLDSRPINWSGVKLGQVCDEIASNLRFATAVARIRYWMVPKPLPAAGDIAGLAAYWKAHYNTPLGRGTEAEFIKNYHKMKEIT